MRGGSLMQFARNKYSQNGEDGVLCEIIRRLDIDADGPGTFVEFGVGNGRDLSNTLRLAECGWSGVWIEQNEESFKKAFELSTTFEGRVQVFHGSVGFQKHDCLDVFLDQLDDVWRGERFLPRVNPSGLDFLSIDIDSFDLAVWRATSYRPKVVLIEINSGIPLGTEYEHVQGSQEGNSWTSMVKLGREKGYAPVCHTGNVFFVRDDLVNKLGLPLSEIENLDSIFNPMWSEWGKK
jgi:hypothetical protein